MAKSVNEQLSAFVDGELNLEEQQLLINRMCNDEALKRAWEQYHAIGDCLRGGMHEQMPVDFSQSVMSAIESEPLILAPNSRTQEQPQNFSQQASTNSFGRRVAGFAIAASVATAAVIGLQLQTQTTDDLNMQVAQQAPVSGNYDRIQTVKESTSTFQSKIPAPRVAATQIPLAQSIQQQNQTAQLLDLQHNQNARVIMNGVELVDGTIDHDSSVVLNDQLHKYLVNHNQNVAGSRIVGFMPYARIVASNQGGGVKIKDTQQGQQ